jgi:predicted nucleotidyltransferase
MSNHEIIATLRNEKPYLRQHFGVEEIGIFGSFARGEEKADSDIDIIVSLSLPDYSNFAGLLIYLEKRLNHKIDLVRKGGHLSQKFMRIALKDAVYA